MQNLVKLLVGLLILLGFYLTIEFLTINAFGENYNYNLSKLEREEIWLSEICLNTNIYFSDCDLISGRIDSNYGDKIN